MNIPKGFYECLCLELGILVESPRAFRYAIYKGCQKDANMTFHDYAVDNGRMCSKGGIDSNGRHKCDDPTKCVYNTTDISNFDITKLYPLVSIACEDIARHGTEEFNRRKNQNSDCIESQLEVVKNLRNTVAHSLSNPHQTYEDLKIQIEKLYNAIDAKYNVQGSLEVSNFRDRIKKLEDDLIEGRQDYKVCASILPYRCIQEQKQKQIHVQKYHERQLIDTENRSTINCKEILLFDPGRKMKIINSDPGSGKSYLMGRLTYDWCTDGKHFNNNAPNRIHIPINMRYWCEGLTLATFVKRVYPNSTSIFDDKCLEDAIRDVESLILVDGYDECSDNGRLFVKNIIDDAVNNHKWHLIVATRPVTFQDLRFQSDKTSKVVLTLKSLSTFDERLEFCSTVFPNLDYSKCNQNMSEALKNLFCNPLHLVMLNQVTKQGIIFNSETDLYAALFDEYVNDFKERIRNVSGGDISLANNSVEVIEHFAMKLLINYVFSINKKEWGLLKEKLNSLKNVQWVKLLSSIFNIPEDEKKVSFRIDHASFQEYVASRYIAENIAESKQIDAVKEVIKEITGREPDFPLWRR